MLNPLNAMARDLVGDGKSPNLYFSTTIDGRTIAIMTSKHAAIEFAKVYDADCVEDRKHGVIWPE